jgi:aerobic-type carbon monoxide dehydrogenase small subunit (CoxS/CutS family)
VTQHPTAFDGEGQVSGPPAFDLAPAGADERPCTSYTLRVNGAERPVDDAWIGESLLYVLRERLGLAGAKDGCEQGECGACSVQVDGQLVASCLVPAALAADSEIHTVEGLAADGNPSDVQQALARSGAVQCGYCVPGMAMAVHDLLQRNHRPSDIEAREALGGNLCRCTGYQGVLEAVREVSQARIAALDAEAGEPPAQAPAQQAPEQAAPQPHAPQTAPPVHPEPQDEYRPESPSAAPEQLADAPVYAYEQAPEPSYAQPQETDPGLYGQPERQPEHQHQPEPQQEPEHRSAYGEAPLPGVDPLFGPLDAVLETVAPPPDGSAGYPVDAGYGTYAPDPYGIGVYDQQPYGQAAYHPDPYRQSQGADSIPVPVLYTPDSQAAYDPAHGLGPYDADDGGPGQDHGTPPQGTDLRGSGFDGSGFQGSDYQNPEYRNSEYRTSGYQGPGFQDAGFQGPGPDGASFENTGFENTGFDGTGYDGTGYRGTPAHGTRLPEDDRG